MPQIKTLSPLIRWCFLPILIILLATFIFIEGKNLFYSFQIRRFWIPTTAQITQTNRQGKGVLGKYQYTFKNTEYTGSLFGDPISFYSKTGETIQIWVDPNQPSKSDVPDSLVKIPFLFLLLVGEAGCLWMLLSRHPTSLRK